MFLATFLATLLGGLVVRTWRLKVTIYPVSPTDKPTGQLARVVGA
jgi:hypothetical protein